ncbi:hypothetical protein KKE45_01825, partial [Patescibacteria group bacterium]|nr:hypothetical protein [Patescibacteria group bacterium]
MGKVFDCKFFSKNRGAVSVSLIFALLLMAIAIPVATKLTQQRQDTRNKAAGGVVGDETYRAVGMTVIGDRLFQNLFSTNGYDSWSRYCNVNSGVIDWTSCTGWGHYNMDKMRTEAGGERYSAVGMTVIGDRLFQNLFSTNGYDSWSRYCNVNSGVIDWTS